MNLLTCPINALVTDALKLDTVKPIITPECNLEFSIEEESDYLPDEDLGISPDEVDCNFTNDFTDGKLDGEHNFEPVAYQWSNSGYRKGYLIGMASRMGIEYTLIHGVKSSKVMIIN